MRALIIAWKDLRHTYRSPAGLAMMLVAPLLLAFVLGMAFGSGDTFSVARVKTVVVDQDRGAGAGGPAAGAMLTGVLTAPEMSDLLEVVEADTPEKARELVDNGEADVAVIIPAGLSETLEQPVRRWDRLRPRKCSSTATLRSQWAQPSSRRSSPGW